jgi:hypothetical protein
LAHETHHQVWVRTNWQNNLMTNLLRERTLSMITGQFTEAEKKVTLNYRVYPNMAKVKGGWLRSQPISMAQIHDDVYVAACVGDFSPVYRV